MPVERATLGDLVRPGLITLAPDTQIDNAVATLLNRNVSGAPVIDDAGHLVGIITAKDCFRAALQASYHQSWGGVVADYMTRDVQTLDAGTDIVTAAQKFLEAPYRRFPVVVEDRLIGIVTRLDVLRALNAQWTSP